VPPAPLLRMPRGGQGGLHQEGLHPRARKDRGLRVLPQAPRFTQSLVLQSNFPQLCTTCHADVVGGEGGGFDHLAVKDVNCASCHDPHASDVKGLLRGSRPRPVPPAIPASPPLSARRRSTNPSPKETAPPATHPIARSTGACWWRPRKRLRPLPRSVIGAAGTPHATGGGGASCASCHDPTDLRGKGGRLHPRTLCLR